MTAERRSLPIAGIALAFVGLAVIAVCALRPPPTDPVTLDVVELEQPVPEPEPNAQSQAETFPVPLPDEVEQWQSGVAQLVGAVNGACGARVEPTCHGGACVYLFDPNSPNHAMRIWRRPQLVYEIFAPKPLNRCYQADSRTRGELRHIAAKDGLWCHGFVMTGHPHAERDASALCRQLLGTPSQSP